jgi:hypothetical protein
MMLPEVVLILVGVIPLDIAIHTQSACRIRLVQYYIGVDIGMTLLEVVTKTKRVGRPPLEIAIQTQPVLEFDVGWNGRFVALARTHTASGWSST